MTIIERSVGFDIGTLITGSWDGVTIQAVVLDKAEDSGRLLLMTLAGGEVFEVAGEAVQDWVLVPPPQARWVEVCDAESDMPFFAAYLPDFKAAVAVYRAFEARDGDFRVEITTNDATENETLDGIGYFGNGATP